MTIDILTQDEFEDLREFYIEQIELAVRHKKQHARDYNMVELLRLPKPKYDKIEHRRYIIDV